MHFVTPQSPTNGAESGGFNPAILAELAARGLVFQSSNGLAEHLAEKPRTIYAGADPTADSLHIGSLVPLLTMRRLQLAGHTPIVLIGGATGLIGDPSFKAQERRLNTAEIVAGWTAKLQKQAARFLSFDGANAARMANNYDWTHGVGVLDFLRDVGKFFSVNAMIARDAVKSRLERADSGISFTEFSYALLQAFDFLHLYREQACTVQFGGSDQWGNITAGTELVHKAAQGQAFAFTVPLITKADGTKFGKTETGTVWIDAEKTSPYAFYQFFLNVADEDVERLLLIYSFRPVAEIKELMVDHASAPEKRAAQLALASELTELVHGVEAREAAQRISAVLFGGKIPDLTEADLGQLAQDGLPTTVITPENAEMIDALVATSLASSKREARDFINNGSVLHNGATVGTETIQLTADKALFGKYHLLRRGKKNYALLVHS